MRSLSDDALLRRLSEVLGRLRRDEADLVALIGEVDARRLYAREATPSMFAYCTERLHLSEPEAILRIRVARASREHPVLLAMLREGKLHLSGIALLAPLLTRKNRAVLLKRAAHRSKEEIKELVAELSPRPDAPTQIRRLPARVASGAGAPSGPLCPDTVGPGKSLSSSDMPSPADAVSGADRGVPRLAPSGANPGQASAPAEWTPPAGASPSPPAPGSPAAAPARPASMEPLAPARYKVQFTASAQLRDKLQKLQALMRSSVPDGDLATVIEAAVDEKIEQLEKKRFAKVKAPRSTSGKTDTAPTSRHIPAAVRRAVHARDQGRCAYVDEHGNRCRARDRLEFHHHGLPFGLGGDHAVGNVRLMCRTHNNLMADHDFEKEKMTRHRAGAGGLAMHAASGGAIDDHRGEGVTPPP